MPLRGSGYRWVARRRLAARQKKEHRHKSIKDLHELRRMIFGDTVTPAVRKKAMAEVRAQKRMQLMELERRQPPKESKGARPQGQDFSYEVIHSPEPSFLLQSQEPRQKKGQGR